ncbi:hypothetical protein [Alteromonas sp. KUL49]|uniref:hypothetical protein n=1 Tax=Alteromonas sp. KUL49 TaxID=2480798 RepID=UPI00102F2034|nr:hypothetical protein [Alteromonas sp. KUL49]TAP40969.1 hypothetical protein EYS00_07640 [Alteromonas sp. KUL49]GEA11154.1 ABC transporter substrate-binding protein [Alteromonas sp. KUL49]
MLKFTPVYQWIAFAAVSVTSTLTMANELAFVRTQLGEKYTCAHKALDLAYQNLGYKVKYLTLPSERGLQESNNGHYDGEMLRVKGLEEDYANLIPVEVPICYVQSIIVARPHVDLASYDNFKKYRFGITQGFVGLERMVEEHQLPVIRAVDHETLLQMLDKNRIEMAVVNRETAEAFLKSRPADSFIIIEKFVRNVGLYHYLHKKHAMLVPSITEQLQSISHLGFIDIPNKE